MKHKYALQAALFAIAAIVLILARGLLIRGTHDRKAAAQTPTSAPTATGLAQRTPEFASPPNASLPVAATNKIFLTAALLWQKPIAEEAFAQFHDWAERYAAGGVSEKSALEVEGIALATTRREALAALIKTDPERALELSVPVGVRRALSPVVQSLLEERVSGRGTLAVLGVLPEPGKEDQVAPTIRTAQLGTRELNAFVYGRRLGEPTRANIPLNGIAVDNYFAVNENAVRVLEPEEAAAAKAQNTEAICSVSGQAANLIQQEVAAEVGGQTVFLCRADHVVELNERVVAAESGPPGPEGDGPEASTWTEGLKKLILIRVDFPDVTLSLTEGGGATLVSNLHNFYSEMSYGRTGFQLVGSGSDVTPTFRMTNAAAWYGTNDYYNQLRTEARAAATAAGYTLGNYDRDVICLGAVPGFGWSGLAYVGGAGAWLRDNFSTGVAGHELGHNWGLNHANFWDTSSQSVIGPGTSVEYGDTFDTMGSASAGNNHFNARYKNYLNWLTTNEVVTATTNGTYRVYAHDDPNSSGIRGLKIVKNSQTNYWVEFRQKFTSTKWLMNGAGLRWAQSGNQKSHLLDTTPGSTDLKNDAAIVIGRTFSDKESGIHITPIDKGGTSPESLDVVVNLGSFPANLPPALGLMASATNAAPGVAINFTANASDPDGDSLAYWWDFGDGTFATTNSAVARKSWSAAGEYLVRCVASDMKGGVADKYVVVTIGSPATFRISGQINDANGPLEGVRVYVSTARMSYTDSDGHYSIVGLPAGNYNVNAMLQNYSFTTSGFNNPVSVGPNKSAIDFLASYSGSSPPTITTQPSSQAVNPGANAAFTVAATGTPPPAYQWRFNGANISGATAASYTKSNVQATDTGNYSVVVSNVAGTATSANAVLSFNSAPTITGSARSQTVIAGNNATFTVTAGGTAPFYYQWQFNDTNIAGAMASSFTRVAAQPADAGGYRVVVTNSVGSVTSAVAILAVIVPPQITVPPQSLRVVEGQDATFSVTATGTAILSCQWRFDEVAISGATNATLCVSNPTPASAGNYSITITNLAGTVTSTSAALVISVRPNLSSRPLLVPGQVEWQLTGTPGDTYAIESSSNLQTWTPAATLTNMTGTLQFTDPTAVNQPRRFYRVRLVP